MKIKERMTIERLLNRTYKATIGQAYGTGKSQARAMQACESRAVDILVNVEAVRIELRDGYLIVSQVESSESSWYLIKKLDGAINGRIYPACFLHPSKLKQAIESHLAQYRADETEVAK